MSFTTRRYIIASPMGGTVRALFGTRTHYHHTHRLWQNASSGANIEAADLRAALRVLNLDATCTDAEIKEAFRVHAKRHHPDLVAGASSGRGSEEDMVKGTESYQLLRQTTAKARRAILRHGQPSPGGGSGSTFYTAEEYAKARRAYEGRPRSMDDNFADHILSPHTDDGTRRTAYFNITQARVSAMKARRAHQQRDAPPWHVHDGEAASTRSSSHCQSPSNSKRFICRDRCLGVLGQYVQYSYQQIREDLQQLHKYRAWWGNSFTGADDQANTARLGGTMSDHLLYLQRSRDRALVQKSLGRLFSVLLVTICTMLLVALVMNQLWRCSPVPDSEVAAASVLAADALENGG